MDNIISSISGDGLTQQRLKRTPATCQTKYWNSYIEMQMSFQKTKIKKLKIFYILSFLIEFLKNSEDFQQYSA